MLYLCISSRICTTLLFFCFPYNQRRSLYAQLQPTSRRSDTATDNEYDSPQILLYYPATIAHPLKLYTPSRSTPPQNSKPALPGSGQSELHSDSSTCVAAATGAAPLHWHTLASSTPAKVNPSRAHACRHWLTKSRLVSKVCVSTVVNAGASTKQPSNAQLPGRSAGKV